MSISTESINWKCVDITTGFIMHEHGVWRKVTYRLCCHAPPEMLKGELIKADIYHRWSNMYKPLENNADDLESHVIQQNFDVVDGQLHLVLVVGGQLPPGRILKAFCSDDVVHELFTSIERGQLQYSYSEVTRGGYEDWPDWASALRLLKKL